MKHGLAFFMGCTLFSLGVAFASVLSSNAAPPPTATPQNPPDTIACFVGDTLFVLPKWTPSTTPTRIPTPTPLLEASPTRMVILTPQPTATPACVSRTLAFNVNTRTGPGVNFALIGNGLKAGAVVQVAEFRTVTVNGVVSVWGRLCGTETWFSVTASGAK